ncbi:MAG TPA: phosphoribosyltransferase family protein [candidate division Zixibacteria bacterium]|jgi:ComF family protein
MSAFISQTAHDESRLFATATEAVCGTVFFPKRCPVCGSTVLAPGRAWCHACDTHVRLWDQALCFTCRRWRGVPEDRCHATHEESRIRGFTCLGAYDAALGAVVRELKYSGALYLAGPLGSLLASRLDQDASTDLIVPIPTARGKVEKRGVAHAEEIARSIGQATGAEVATDALAWRRRVADQTALTPAQREANLSEALGVRDASLVAGRDVLIVDDVTTTGATINEAARALSAGGAARTGASVVAINLGQTG